MQAVETNPSLYCVSCWRFMGLGDIHEHLLSRSAAGDWDPSLLFPSRSLLHTYTIRVAMTSQSVSPPTCNLQPQDTHSQAHTPPRLSLLVAGLRQPAWQPVTSAAGSAAVHHCRLAFSRALCCPAIPEAAPSSARHPARTKEGKAKLCHMKAIDGATRDMRKA